MDLAVAFHTHQIDGTCLRMCWQPQCQQRFDRNAGSCGKVVGGAQWQQGQRRQSLRLLTGMRHRFGDFAQCAIAATGDQQFCLRGNGFAYIAFGVACFPGHAHLEVLPLPAQLRNRVTHGIVASGLAVEDQVTGRCVHAVLH
ncbi:hypothetical protein D3C71_1162470 [compost metagenome]